MHGPHTFLWPGTHTKGVQALVTSNLLPVQVRLGEKRWGIHSICYLTESQAVAKSLQSCPTLCDPIDGSPLDSPVPGISRQKHWNGLPFPAPTRESEVAQSFLTLSGPMGCIPPWDFPGKNTGVGCHCLLQSHRQYTPTSPLPRVDHP